MAKSYHGGNTLYHANDFKNFIHDRHLGIEADSSSSSRAMDKKIEEYNEWKSELLEIMIERLAVRIKSFAEKGNKISQSGQPYNKAFILHKRDWDEINRLHQLIACYKLPRENIFDISWLKDLQLNEKGFIRKICSLILESNQGSRLDATSRGFGVFLKSMR